MSNSIKRLSGKAGALPGALVHVGDRKAKHVKISVIDFSADSFSQRDCEKVEESYSYMHSESMSWLNIDGLHEVDVIEKIGKEFGLHVLLLEDVMNTRLRPKVEFFDDHVFLSFKMLGIGKGKTGVVSEQVSLVLSKTCVISFQEQEGDIFSKIRERLQNGHGQMRKRGLDYLLYRLIDTVVDHYFYVVEYLSDKVEHLEDKVLKTHDESVVVEIMSLKKQLIKVRRAVMPLREAVASLQREESDLISEGTERYIRDVYEHLIHVNDALDNQRDLVGGLLDLYHTSISNRMNQVMKVLTIIATIFIPLTFVAGIYGMNFDPESSAWNMPELSWKYGYLGTWIVMVIITVVMLIFFKRKRWL